MDLVPIKDYTAYLQFRDQMLALPQAEFVYRHHFSKGVYTREMDAKAGTLILGKVHRHEVVNILTRGAIALYDNESDFTVIEAPYVFVSNAGISKVGLVLEDITWINCIGTDKTDIEEIEREFLMSDEELLGKDIG